MTYLKRYHSPIANRTKACYGANLLLYTTIQLKPQMSKALPSSIYIFIRTSSFFIFLISCGCLALTTVYSQKVAVSD